MGKCQIEGETTLGKKYYEPKEHAEDPSFRRRSGAYHHLGRELQLSAEDSRQMVSNPRGDIPARRSGIENAGLTDRTNETNESYCIVEA